MVKSAIFSRMPAALTATDAPITVCYCILLCCLKISVLVNIKLFYSDVEWIAALFNITCEYIRQCFRWMTQSRTHDSHSRFTRQRTCNCRWWVFLTFSNSVSSIRIEPVFCWCFSRVVDSFAEIQTAQYVFLYVRNFVNCTCTHTPNERYCNLLYIAWIL